MIGTVATVTLVTIEVLAVAYNLNRNGVFDGLKTQIKNKLSSKKAYDTKDKSYTIEAEVIS